MRIAVLSDIHGFAPALEVVLADLEARGPFDEVVVAGDLCEVGPEPARVLDLLRDRPFTVVTGNTDREIVEAAEQRDANDEIRFVLKQIGRDGIDYLAGLPEARRITPPGGRAPDDDLLVVHANPHNLHDRLDPEASDRELRGVIGRARFGAIAFGHIHVCYVRRLGQSLLVDVSAVGNPKDGDLRCKYGVLTWDRAARRWDAELVKLPYPLAETERCIRASALPDPERVLAKLVKASY